MLFAALDALCRQRGVASAFLLTSEANLPAMAFYRALGAGLAADGDVMFEFDWGCVAAPHGFPRAVR